MSYTSDRHRETVTHVESDTWTCRGREMRLHTYMCCGCHSTFTWTTTPYRRCPWCGVPVILYRKGDAR